MTSKTLPFSCLLHYLRNKNTFLNIFTKKHCTFIQQEKDLQYWWLVIIIEKLPLCFWLIIWESRPQSPVLEWRPRCVHHFHLGLAQVDSQEYLRLQSVGRKEFIHSDNFHLILLAVQVKVALLYFFAYMYTGHTIGPHIEMCDHIVNINVPKHLYSTQ
jgi:hypothetical protein